MPRSSGRSGSSRTPSIEGVSQGEAARVGQPYLFPCITDIANSADLATRAEEIEKRAEREAWRAPAPPSNPVDADSDESIEWLVSEGYAPTILELVARARERLARGDQLGAENLLLKAELEERTMNAALRRIYENKLRARAAPFRRGRRPGSLDPLDKVLVKILRADPYMQAKDVLAHLKARARSSPRDIVAKVRPGAVARPPIPGSSRQRKPRKDAFLVIWKSKAGERKRTAWSSVRDRRLPRLRKLVRPTK